MTADGHDELGDQLLLELHAAGATVAGISAAWRVDQAAVRARLESLGAPERVYLRHRVSEVPDAADLARLAPMFRRLPRVERPEREGLPGRDLLRTCLRELPRLHRRLERVQKALELVRGMDRQERARLRPRARDRLAKLANTVAGDIAYAEGAVASLTVGHGRTWRDLERVAVCGYVVRSSLDAVSPAALAAACGEPAAAVLEASGRSACGFGGEAGGVIRSTTRRRRRRRAAG